jgi:DNA polymerase I
MREIVVADTEYEIGAGGDRPAPVCVVAHEIYSGRRFRLMLDQTAPASPPWATGPDVLFAAFVAGAARHGPG